LVVSGTVPAIGQASQLTATKKIMLSDGTRLDVTKQATWSSSNTTVATITAAGGLLTVLTPGCAEITATYQEVSGKLDLGPPNGAGCWD
jgi:hypothetical protein